MSEEKSAFILAREKALNITLASADQVEYKYVAIPESLIDIDSGTMMGWLKKRTTNPEAKQEHLILTSDPDVLKLIQDLNVTIFSAEDS